MGRKYLFRLSFICFLFQLNSFSQIDSSCTRSHSNLFHTISYSNNFSASYIHYKNWKYNGYNNFSFLLRSNWSCDTIGQKWEMHFRFNGELGYLKFVDSAWYKNSDCVDVGVEIVRKTDKTFQNIFTFYFNSQFLSTYDTYYNADGGYTKRWTSGFGNPMNIDLGYGTSVHFWKTCRVNLTFVTLRTSTLPINEGELLSQENNIIRNKTLITSEYGLGIQTFIRKNIGKRVRWENYSRAFANAINQQKFNIDFRNRLVVKVFKYLDLIVDNRIKYLPYPPYKFQFRNELMLSFTLEKI